MFGKNNTQENEFLSLMPKINKKSTAKGGFMSGSFKEPAQNKTIGGDYSNGRTGYP